MLPKLQHIGTAELELPKLSKGSEQVLSDWMSLWKKEQLPVSSMQHQMSAQGAYAAFGESGLLSQQSARVAAPSRSVPRRHVAFPAPARRHVVLHEVRRSCGIFNPSWTAIRHAYDLSRRMTESLPSVPLPPTLSRTWCRPRVQTVQWRSSAGWQPSSSPSARAATVLLQAALLSTGPQPMVPAAMVPPTRDMGRHQAAMVPAGEFRLSQQLQLLLLLRRLMTFARTLPLCGVHYFW